jgi:valyl-tRNA synthetase
MRYLAALCALGQDNNFKPQDLIRGKRFVQKLWNVQQFIGTSLSKAPEGYLEVEPTNVMDLWLLDRLASLVERTREAYERFDFAPVLRDVEYFVWHELADHYIELVKARVYSGEDVAVFNVLGTVGLAVTKLLAPILPCITEQVYQDLYRTSDGAKSVHLSLLPTSPATSAEARAVGDFAKEVAAAVRRWKSEVGLALNEPLASVQVLTETPKVEAAAGDLASALVTKDLTFAREDPTLHEEPRALKPVHARLGPEFRASAKEIAAIIATTDPAEATRAVRAGGWKVRLGSGEEATLTTEHVSVESGWVSHGHAVDTLTVDGAVIVITRE